MDLLSNHDTGLRAVVETQRLTIDRTDFLDLQVVLDTTAAERMTAFRIERIDQRLQADLTEEIFIDRLVVVVQVCALYL